MLSQQHRFHGHKSLGFVYHKGATVRGTCMSLKFAHNARRSEYRAAVIVSRKVHKSAVERNRVRRRLYETIRRHESTITGPYDMVLTVFSDNVIDMPSIKLEKTVNGLLTKADIIKSPTESKPPSRAIVKSNEDRV